MRDEKSEIQKIKKSLLSSKHSIPFMHDYAHEREKHFPKIDVCFTPESGHKST